MRIPASLLRMIPSAAVGAAAFTLSTQTAFAFFPPLPGPSGPVTVSPPPPPPVIIPVSPEIPSPPPVVPPPPVIPPVPPPPFVPPPVPVSPPPPVDPVGDPDCPVNPQEVPEPASIISGLIGLSVLGGYSWKRRKKGNATN